MYNRVSRGLWGEVVPLLLVCCFLLILEGRTGALVLPHPLNLSYAGSKCHSPGLCLSRHAKPCERVMLTRHHWANNLLEVGYWPGQMMFLSKPNGHVFETRATHLVGETWLWSGMEREELRHATSP